MITETEFIKRLAYKGNPRWTKEGWEKIGWEQGESKWNYYEAREVCKAFLNTLTECLAEGQDVNFPGFGKFEIRKTKARSSVNFDQEEIHIRSHKRVHFTQSKPLRTLVDTPESGGDM